MKPVALFLSDQITVPVADVLSVIKSVNNEVVAEKDVHICTYASSLKQLPIESASLSTVVSVLKDSKSLPEELLGDIFRALKPGGNFLSLISSVAGDLTIKPTQTFEKKLLLSGYVDIQATEGNPIFPVDGSKVIIIKASKASWSIGLSFSIKKNVNVLPKIQIDDDSDLIDEDSLLSEDDLKRPQLPVVGDCEVSSTRKACKNCSCGRAEAEAAGEKLPKLGLTLEQLNNPQSSCGNCGLGDAFRCGTCPYRGLPPFKPGEKISLTGNFLVADI